MKIVQSVVTTDGAQPYVKKRAGLRRVGLVPVLAEIDV
jgi:hypothetical protein